MKEENIIKMFNTLKRISQYQPYEKLKRSSEKQYGLDYEEALEYSYENVIYEAKYALKGIRLPKKVK